MFLTIFIKKIYFSNLCGINGFHPLVNINCVSNNVYILNDIYDSGTFYAMGVLTNKLFASQLELILLTTYQLSRYIYLCVYHLIMLLAS